jgi:hypothetical protein
MTVALDDGRYTTFALNSDTYAKLLKGFGDPILAFDIERASMFFQLSGADQQINIATFAELHIRQRVPVLDPAAPRLRIVEPVGGADYPYVLDCSAGILNIEQRDQLCTYLQRLEIGVDNKTYSCFVYALKHCPNINPDLINKINCRCLCR